MENEAEKIYKSKNIKDALNMSLTEIHRDAHRLKLL